MQRPGFRIWGFGFRAPNPLDSAPPQINTEARGGGQLEFLLNVLRSYRDVSVFLLRDVNRHASKGGLQRLLFYEKRST